MSQVDSEGYPQVAEYPLGALLRKPLENEDRYKAVVNPVKQWIYSIVSSNYQIVKHEEVVAIAKEFLRAEIGMGNLSEEIELTHKGGRLYASWLFKKPLEVQKNDRVQRGLRVRNSYDLSAGILVELIALREICSNGMTIEAHELQGKRKHIGVNTLEDLEPMLQNVIDTLEVFDHTLEKSLEIWVTRDKAEELIRAQKLPEKYTKTATDIIKQGTLLYWGDKVTLWETYNSLTWAISHINPEKFPERRIAMEKQVASILKRCQ